MYPTACAHTGYTCATVATAVLLLASPAPALARCADGTTGTQVKLPSIRCPSGVALYHQCAAEPDAFLACVRPTPRRASDSTSSIGDGDSRRNGRHGSPQ
jgi:hypothetical protein